MIIKLEFPDGEIIIRENIDTIKIKPKLNQALLSVGGDEFGYMSPKLAIAVLDQVTTADLVPDPKWSIDPDTILTEEELKK